MVKNKIFWLKSSVLGRIFRFPKKWLFQPIKSEALGYSNPREAVRDHVSEENRGMNEMDTSSKRQNLAIINESGLYVKPSNR